jgi:deoxyribodipyrimidine photo-lyase
MEKPLESALVWFRRDLRTDDHAALYHALKAARRVWCVFVLDRDILDPLLERGLQADRRVEFIVDSLHDLDGQLQRLAAADGRFGLIVRHGSAREEIPRLARELHVQAVYASHDDEPAALERDAQVRGALADAGIALHTGKDHVVFERNEVLSGGGTPYAVFTPYKNAWLKKLEPFYLKAYPVERYAAALAPLPDGVSSGPPALERIGFAKTNLHEMRLPVGPAGAQSLLADFLTRIDDYATARDYPAVKGPSYLSVHLRFGTLSVRTAARAAFDRMQAGSAGAATWLSELVWRDFYHQVLHHHPQVVDHAYKPRYDALRFEHGKHAETRFAAWCAGRTGYPLVDAAMAQINQTGYMHKPPAHGERQLPGEGPGHRLAPRRTLFRRPPDRLRPRREQRRLAVGRLDRLRRAAVVPHLPSGDAEPEVRSRREVHPALRAPARIAARRADPCTVAGLPHRVGGSEGGAGKGLSGADRRP